MELAVDLPPPVRAAVTEAVARLREVYGDRLDRVILYGSYARGDARPDSDVDLLVVLRGEYNRYQEVKQRTGPIEFDLFERLDLDVSIHMFSDVEVGDMRSPFMRNIRDEGLPV